MAGKISQGTLLQRENSPGGGAYTTIANVASFDGPSTENAEIDVSALNATAKEYLPGLVDYGELSMEVNFDPNQATHQQIMNDMEASPPTVSNWRIVFVNPTINWTWQAFVKSFAISGAVDNKLTGNVTLRLAGTRVVS